MRKLTLKGFLKQYLVDLSYCGSNSVTKLIKELPYNPRLAEPLSLYAVLNGTSDAVINKDSSFAASCNMVKENINNYPSISDKYSKLNKTYVYYSSAKKNDDDSKMLMHRKIVELKQSKNLTAYRISKDVGLNRGNVNNFIKNANCDSLSLDHVRDILKYVKEC